MLGASDLYTCEFKGDPELPVWRSLALSALVALPSWPVVAALLAGALAETGDVTFAAVRAASCFLPGSAERRGLDALITLSARRSTS